MALTRSKQQRNLAIYKYYLTHPEVTVSEIAKDYSLSSQRVRFLISRQFRDDRLSRDSLVEKYVIKEICP